MFSGSHTGIAMTTIELFWISGSPPSWRVMLALEVKSLHYTAQQLDASTQAHKSPEFLNLNPRGQVPVLRCGDLVVRESLAIIAYVDRLKPDPSLFGRDLSSTAAIWQQMMDFENNLRPEIATIALSVFRNQVSDRTADIASAAEKIQAEIQTFDRHLLHQNYLCGEALSAADITVYPTLQWLRRALAKNPVPSTTQKLTDALTSYSNLVRWESRVEQLPNYDRTYPPHWR
jgi:glutathione S-transferase